MKARSVILAAYPAFLCAGIGWIAMHGDASRGATVDANTPARAERDLRDSTTVQVALAEDAAAKTDAGIYKGRVLFDGKAPPRKISVEIGKARKDPAVCAANVAIPSDTLVVDPKTNAVANVCIYLQKPPEGFKAVVAAAPVVFDQKNCRFTPHIVAVQVGQKLLLLNDDNALHNTRFTPFRGSPAFNQALAPNTRENKAVEYIYRAAESVPVPVNCDFHDWMKGYHLVCNHPFMAVTKEDGTFEIKDLPPGKYEFVVWSTKFLDRKHAVEIKAGMTTEETLKYGPERFEL